MKLDTTLSTPLAAIVTGGASGLGEGTARMLAAAGVKVGIFDMNEERGQSVAQAIGGVFAKVNVANNASVDAGFAAVRGAIGQERIFVNCAGIGGGIKTASRKRDTGEIVAHDADAFMRIININLIGSFLCASKSAAGMMALDPTQPDGERGVIINTASVAAQDGQIGQVAYAASKGGILSMALPMARDLAREGIRVNTILPGFYETPIYEQMKPEVKESLRAHVQFPNRFGQPDEYADVVRFMIEHGYINGEYIRTDAGARMPPR
ncbi:SDR family NAD(P)-dependent oxidoreductase [Algimonas porphyrae]|uniref:3-hydroxyacyl-CoA dehydrogenase n=1 Tax=Algimonas porphyrae TaxID=1128113 RepID=A0ABQ5UZD4_9PROT|nr:SDR family NAD(P)-dependent oxidoreductase [Algimonas porphyrae]GLQ20655.1 3-hydroxyacyl-CoA dehydrogenase [Algimonas porphyrae]